MVEVFLDGADLASIEKYAKHPLCTGITTNPSLMKKAGIKDYYTFAQEVLKLAKGKAVSFEVLADDIQEMKRQALEIARWGENVFVKIPITNAEGVTTAPLCGVLAAHGVKVNVTAVMTLGQIRNLTDYLSTPGNIVSVFAGRVADTGRDPKSLMTFARQLCHQHGLKLLWASAREVVNVVQAEDCGVDIITLPPELLAKMDGFGRDLEDYSLETVRQFKQDAEGISL